MPGKEECCRDEWIGDSSWGSSNAKPNCTKTVYHTFTGLKLRVTLGYLVQYLVYLVQYLLPVPDQCKRNCFLYFISI